MVQRILMNFQAHHPQSESPNLSHLNWCTDLMFIFSPKLWERYVQYRKRGELSRDVQVADDRRQLCKDIRLQNRCQKLEPRKKGAFPCFKEGLCCLEQMNFQSSTTPQIVHELGAKVEATFWQGWETPSCPLLELEHWTLENAACCFSKVVDELLGHKRHMRYK